MQNCFNMAFVLHFLGYYVYKFISDSGESHRPCGMTIVGGCRRFLYRHQYGGPLCAAIEFGIQPLLFTNAAGQPLYCPYPLSVSIPMMMASHLTIAGGVEVIFTLAIFAFIKKVSRGTFTREQKENKSDFRAAHLAHMRDPFGLIATGNRMENGS
jgi:cobalt/nickel transport system permease protein